MQTDWKKIANEFSIDSDLVWLNSCGVSIPPIKSNEAVGDYLQAFSQRGIMQEKYPHGVIKKNIVNKFSEFLGGRPEEYAILQNTAEAMHFLAHSLPVQSGDRMLLVDKEFPSNIYPHWQLKQKGVEFDYVAPALSNAAFIENFKKAITPKTRYASVSAVDWLTGLRMDLESIGNLCKEKGIILIVDAAQGAGHVPIDVKKYNISAMAFSCWKWLLGPLGSAGFYIDSEFMKTLNITAMGTSSVVNDAVYLPYRTETKSNAERFMLSTAAYMNWIHLNASLNFIAAIGLSSVQSQILLLAEKIATILRENGFNVLCDNFGVDKTGIVSAHDPERDMNEIFAEFQRRGIICALREGNLRFSPHIHLTEERIEALEL